MGKDKILSFKAGENKQPKSKALQSACGEQEIACAIKRTETSQNEAGEIWANGTWLLSMTESPNPPDFSQLQRN